MHLVKKSLKRAWNDL